MATFNRYSYLATVGNMPVKAGGQPVILPGNSDDVWNVLAGEIVIWDQRKNLTLSVGDIATAKNISIGVGQGSPGQLAKEIIHIAGEDINLCNAKICVNATAPSCGQPQVLDLFFDGTVAGDTSTIVFHLDDAKVRSQLGHNETASYTFSVPTAANCDECTPQENCDELSCAFVDAINGVFDRESSPYFRRASLDQQYQPFRASRIFNAANSRKIFCINPVDSDCEDCAYLPAITGVVVDGVTTNFTNTTNPNDSSQTFHGQLARVVEQMDAAVKVVGGGARLSKGTKACCPSNITVNTCASTVTLLMGGQTVQPCDQYNPFTSQIRESVCKGCGVEPETVTLTCGFSVEVDAYEPKDNCMFPAEAVNYYGRTLTPQFTGDGWQCYNNYWIEAQEQRLPSGLGTYWQDKAHSGQHNGGSGRDFRNSNFRQGRLALPDKFSRAMNADNLIQGKETYCVYNVLSTDRDTQFFNNALQYFNTDVSYLLIPEKDVTTKNSFESYLLELQQRSICCADGNVICGARVLGDIIVSAEAGTPGTVNVSGNDIVTCAGAKTYVVSDKVNVTVTGTGPSFTYTPTAEGAFSFTYTVLCDGESVGQANVTGTASA